MAKRGTTGNEPPEDAAPHAHKSPANSRRNGLPNSLAVERSYTPRGEVPVPGGTGLEPEVEAMCALLAGVSLRLNENVR